MGDRTARRGPAPELVAATLDEARALVAAVRARWQDLLDSLDATFRDAAGPLESSCRGRRELQAPLEDDLRRPRLRAGAGARATRSTREVLRGRVFVALHMHAGDGNVHTNIPVNSDDYEMLQEANAAVARDHGARARARRRDLGRARHRHHQARVPDRRRARAVRRLQAARRSARAASTAASCCATPRCLPTSPNAYTPSFSLIGHESLILEQSEIGAIADSIKDCLRCGKCKPVCATHVPRANLLYSPRNKILATSLLIEAFLYEEQTRRGVSLRHFDEFGDVADHCTVCHKCVNPCPVDIDFGDVSIAMRNLLRARGQAQVQSRHGGVDALPERDRSRDDQARARRVMIDVGYRAQRLAYALAKTARPRARADARVRRRRSAARRSRRR